MSIRGASAILAALSLAGLPTDAFAQAQTLENLLELPTTATAKQSEPPETVEKLPTPDKSAVDEAAELVRQAYEDDLKTITESPERVVTKLIAAALSTTEPAQRYAILLVAENAAVAANKSGLALRAFDARAAGFAFDDVLERLALLETLLKRSAKIDSEFFRSVTATAQQALDTERYEQAEKAAGLAITASKAIEKSEKALAAEAKRKRQQSPEPIAESLADEATALQKTVREHKALAADYAVAKDILAANPSDAEAADVVGRYLCFVKDNWQEGLAALAKGKNESLKVIAVRELMLIDDPAPDPKSLFALAGDWWKAAESKSESLTESQAAAMKEHAARMYMRLKGKLSGPLEVAIAEKRSVNVESVSREGGGAGGNGKATGRKPNVVNLLARVDPVRDAVAGQWSMTPAGLMSDGSTPAKLRIPYVLPDEYDFLIDFTTDRAANACQMCSARDSACAFGWCMASGPGAKYYGFSLVDGRGFNANKTTVEKPGLIVARQRYTSVVQVRNDGVSAFLNGKEVSSLQTDYSNVSADEVWSLPKGSLGIGTWRSPTVFHRIELAPFVSKEATRR